MAIERDLKNYNFSLREIRYILKKAQLNEQNVKEYFRMIDKAVSEVQIGQEMYVPASFGTIPVIVEKIDEESGECTVQLKNYNKYISVNILDLFCEKG